MTATPTEASADRGGRARLRYALYALGLATSIAVGWTWWAELHPGSERDLRNLAQDKLLEWLPEAMDPAHDAWYGLQPHRASHGDGFGPTILLVHGLDEPGDIWEDLAPMLAALHFAVWQLRYPNDQGIDRSAHFLAQHWQNLPESKSVVLIGHSMGGLVIRELVSRWIDPDDPVPSVSDRPVAGVILVGTPNHGSEWARLRVWLELRDHLPLSDRRGFSLSSALRDGTGAAKIDLRPGSKLLTRLNARPWPDTIPIQLIGGALVQPTEAMIDSLDALDDPPAPSELAHQFRHWWSAVGDDLGDGVVTLASLTLDGAPPPAVVSASHRGMLRRWTASEDAPPAIPLIVDTLQAWRGRDLEAR